MIASPFVTAAGDAITGFYQGSVGGANVPSGGGTGPGQYPAAEGPANAIDGNAGTKYLNYGNGDSNTSSATKGVGTGFYVTPALGPSIVTGIQVATANDSPNRDPLTISIEGTNATTNLDTGATWTLVADNVNLGIDTDPGRQTYGPVVHFNNTTPYRSYRVIVKSQRGSDNSVQYAEMNLVGSAAAPFVQSVVINNGAAQRSKVTAVTVTFNTSVTFANPTNIAAAFQLTRVGGGVVGGFTATATTTGSVTSVTLGNFTGAETDFGSLADGIYTLRVVGNQVSAGGTQLDGDGDGDGIGGGDYVLTGTKANGLFRLFADVNGDGVVDQTDLGIFRSALNSNMSQANYLWYLDSDNSGVIDQTDLGQFRVRFNVSLF